MTHYDVIVVGAGSMGMAAGYFLAKEGIKVLLIDAFDPPHSQGSYNGETRLIRHAVGEGAEFVPLVLRSQKIFNELQEKTNNQLFMKSGVITFGSPDSDFICKGIEAKNQYQLDDIQHFENGKALQQLFPDLNVPSDYHGFLESNAGILFPENIILTFRRLALEEGADLSVNNPVIDLELSEDFVHIETKKNTFTANKILLSGGAYSNKLLPKTSLDLDLQPSRGVAAWFDADEAFYSSDVFPGFVGKTKNGNVYGFPSISGSGVKIGIGEVYDEDHAEPEFINRKFGSYPKDEGYLRNFLKNHMPKAAGYLKRGEVSLLTFTSDKKFVIDFHPHYSNVVIAAGFSGNGFKYTGAIGEVLGQLLTRGKSEIDISHFSIQRNQLYNGQRDNND